MGKTKKSHHNRQNPVVPAGLSLNFDDDDELNGARPDPVAAIEEQLVSVNNEDKMCGLQTLSMLCQGEKSIQRILSSQIVRITAPMLVDSDQNIRHAASGALRNLSAVSVEVCETLLDLDIFTPLLVLLNQYATQADWVPVFDKNMNDQLDARSDIFLQAVNIVWNLCESTSVALETFNQSQLLRSFVKCLNHQVYGMDIAVAVAQCLLVISEDNPNAWAILSEYTNDFLTLLQLDGDYSCVILRTVSASILANVPVLCAAHTNQILQALSKTFEHNHKQALSSITSDLPLLEKKDVTELDIQPEVESMSMEEETEEQATNRRKKTNLPSPIEIEVKNISNLLLAQRIAAETITNICSPDDDGAWGEEMDDDDSEAESVHDYDTSNMPGITNDQDKLSPEIIEILKSLGVVEKLWQLGQPLPANVLLILSESGKMLLKRYTRLRSSILMCLQNFCNVLTTEDLGGANAIYTVWLELGQQVFQEGASTDGQVVESITALMRAALDHLKKHPELFQQMTPNDLQLMLRGINSCSDSETRANWLKMLGVLGCVLQEPLTKEIVQFMTDICLKEEDCWTLSEAIDAFMDIFADNDWPRIICELNLTQKTKEIERIFKAKIRQNKKSLKDRFPVVNTVRSNLQRFCKYLESQEKSFKSN
ncbi:HEAT repeat-containing protein 3-like [Culicoides brevitarsis]|uniref:HEAT repeat-containing protein 3-like n=1 Tax=Culicoides brevitarsis TaxID=469753 RepID=UPI00307B2D6D